MSMHNKYPYIFNNEEAVAKAESLVHEEFPELRTPKALTTLFVESKASTVFDIAVENFIRTLGGIPRPAEM